MKFEFIGNACGIFVGSNGTKILCDPWIIDGVFDGSWFHYPPLKTNFEYFKDIDAIYISHLHPDHYDEKNFKFDKEIPIIILDNNPNFLKKNLISNGYKNLIEIKDHSTKFFREFELTMFKPFVGHIFEDSDLGNLLDSALLLKDQNTIAVNFNDNTPDKNACKIINKKFKKIDFALMNYNAAGSYPSCFENLKDKEKVIEQERILKRNFDHMIECIEYLKPETVMPFAGSYIIAGKNYEKNNYLGTCTWDECADYLKKTDPNINVVCLNENQIFDIANQKTEGDYERIDIEKMKKYILSLRNIKYDYQLDHEPDMDKILNDISLAKNKLNEKISKFKLNIKTNVFLEVNNNLINIIEGKDKDKKLFCSMDLRLLRRILDRKADWNNSEIGTHISFKRKPNLMEPDAHTMLSFFHL